MRSGTPMDKDNEQKVPPRSPRMRTLGSGALTILLYLVLIDAAVETFLSGSTLKWIVGGAVAAYIGLSILLWRRLGWAAKTITSFLVLLGLLAVTAWLPQGLVQGVTVARQPTPTVLAAVTILVVLLAAWILMHLRFVPLWGKGIIGFRGQSLARLFWCQQRSLFTWGRGCCWCGALSFAVRRCRR